VSEERTEATVIEAESKVAECSVPTRVGTECIEAPESKRRHQITDTQNIKKIYPPVFLNIKTISYICKGFFKQIIQLSKK